jgi:tRNA C32,U32 (ribose-2'-O)-methylase TrmJ
METFYLGLYLVLPDIEEEMVFKLASRDNRQAFHDWFHALMVDNFGTITENWRVDNFLQSVTNIIERAGSTTRELDIIRGFLQTLINKMD